MTGDELRQARESHGLSQEDLATLLDVSQATVSRWEDGSRTMRPSHEKLVKIILATMKPP
jgi:transcriptional regulator with XRE-family HTH domain